MNNIILAILAISVVAAFPLIGDVYAQTPSDAKVTGPNTVEITFSDAVIPTPDDFSFTVTDKGTTEDTARKITSVSGSTELTLTIDGKPLSTGATGTLTWTDLRVRATGADPIPGSTAPAIDAQKPKVMSARIIDDTVLEITFSEGMNPTGTEFTNLIIDGGTGVTNDITTNLRTSVSSSSGSDIVTIDFGSVPIPLDATGRVDIGEVPDDASTPNKSDPKDRFPVDAGQIPMVKDVKVTDTRAIQVTFSEPIPNPHIDDFTGLIVNDKSVSVTVVSPSENVVTLTTATDLDSQATGKIYIAASQFDANNKPTSLVDRVGNVVPSGAHTVTDGIAPALANDESIVNVSKNTIEIKFSEPVKGATKDIFTFNDGIVDRITSRIQTSGSTITLYISGNDLPADQASVGTITIDEGITDLADNEFAAISPTAVSPGQAPTLVDAYHVSYVDDTLGNNSEQDTVIKLTFSENVSIGSGDFDFKYRGDSKPISVTPSAEATVVTLTVDFKIPLTGIGTITIPAGGLTNTDTSVEIKDITETVEASQIPQIKSIEVTGPKEIKIEFSENVTVKDETFSEFKLLPSGETRTINNVNPVDGSDSTVTLEVDGDPLPTDATGTITLMANYPDEDDPVTDVDDRTVPSSLKDSDDILVDGKSIIRNHPVDDGQAPTLVPNSAKIISPKFVEVKFSEIVHAGLDNFVSFTVDGQVRNITDVTGSGSDTILLEIGGSPLDRDDTATVIIRSTTDDEKEPTGLYDNAKNLYDNTNADDPVNVTNGQVPTVVMASITAHDTLTVKFSTSVDANKSAFSNFIVDGEEKSLGILSGSGTDTITITIIGGGIPANVKGTIDIADTIVGSASRASLEAETEYMVDYGQPPSIEDAMITDYNKITIKFKDEVSVINSNITDLKIDSDTVTAFTIGDVGVKEVTLTLNEINNESISREQIAYDATGSFDIKEISNSITQVKLPEAIVDVEIRDAQKPTVKTAKITDNNTLTIEFSEKVNASASNFTNFEIKNDDNTFTPGIIADDIQGSGTDTIMLTITEPKLSPDAEGIIDIAGVMDLADTPNEFAGVTDREVTAGQIPTFVNAVVSSPKTITVTFSEPVIASDGDFAKLVIHNASRNISDVTGSGTDTITLSLFGNDIEVGHSGTITIYDSIKDLAGNNLASEVDAEVKADVYPEIESVEITGFNTITVTFSEPITAVLDDFTNFEIKNDDDYIARNITDIQGSGTDTIILVVSGESLPVGTTGQIDIAPSDISTNDNGTSDDELDDVPVPNSLIDRNGRTLADFYDDTTGDIKLATGTRNLDTSIYENEMVKDGQTETTVTVMGTISHADGTGISGAIVIIDGSDTVTNSNGEYSISDLVTGTYTMTIISPTGLSDSRSITLTTAGENTENFTLGTIPAIRGTVTDNNDNGVAGVTVTVLGVSSMTTDENGAYSFEGVSAGEYRVYITKPDGYDNLTGSSFQQIITVIDGQTATADFNLINTQVGNVVGVVSGSDGPITGATVTISTTPEDSRITHFGTFSFPNITPGSYTITITADGYQDHTEVITVTVGGETRITPTLTSEPTTGSISGVVSGSDTGLLTGVTVTITSTSTTMTTTSNVGLYNFTDVPAGTYSVSFTHPDYNPGSSFVTVTINETAPVPQTTLTPVSTVGVVRGTITDITTGSAISGATVSLGSTTTPVMTAFDGSYTFRDIEAGSYVLSVTFSGYQGTTVRILVSADSATTTNLQLTPVGTPTTTGTITGTVTDVDGNVISGAIVRLLTTPERDAVTNDLGVYAFANVPAGSYTISVEAVGFQTISETGSIQANQTTTTDITLLSINNLSAIRGMVYNDSNGNGKQDPSESGVGDVAVLLVTPAGETISYTSASDGMYMFNDLETGSYTIYIESPFVYTLVDLGELPLTVDLGL